MSETKKTIEKVEEVKENPVVAKLKEYGITAEIIKTSRKNSVSRLSKISTYWRLKT